MFGLRFRRHRPHTGKMHPAAIVGICLAAAVLLTLTVGNLLKLWLDDETYQRLTEGKEEVPVAENVKDAAVHQINAYPFMLGENVDDVIHAPAVSLPINRVDGSMNYTSEVSSYLGLSRNEEVVLLDSIGELNAFVRYISGVFYPQAFLQSSSDLLYTAAIQESAILREFIRAGGSEILLCGIPLSVENIDAVCTYLQAVKAAVPNAAVGVAIPFSVASDENNWEILATLEKYCDFYALDLTEQTLTDEEEVPEGEASPAAVSLLSDCAYYLSQYQMRILLSEDQTALLSTLELQMNPNYQVLFGE